jgi:hypothetical protein
MLYITKYIAQGFCHKSSRAIDHSQLGEILPETLRKIKQSTEKLPPLKPKTGLNGAPVVFTFISVVERDRRAVPLISAIPF